MREKKGGGSLQFFMSAIYGNLEAASGAMQQEAFRDEPPLWASVTTEEKCDYRTFEQPVRIGYREC